jgi:hypothetical protein
VGGAPLGGPVPAATVTLLNGASKGDAGFSSGTLTWLYPYDQTVWPQGLLPPLLQWTAPPTPASAVYIHLKQANYEFKGYYAGKNLINQPIDPTAWKTATNSNGGDPLHVEVTVTDGTNVYGPIAETWTIAPGQLKGIVYYSSYNTQLAYPVNGAAPPTGAAILSIRSGSTSPALAIPGGDQQCIICHEVSGDGNTLFADTFNNGGPFNQYGETDSWNLRGTSGTPTQRYTGATTKVTSADGGVTYTYMGSSPDGTVNDRKFLWSGLWIDGSFALQGSGNLVQETYGAAAPAGFNIDTDSRVFRRTDGNTLPAPGFDGQIKQAVTPAFSPDGTKVVFNFLSSQPTYTGTLGQGYGHTLDLMDFACGMPIDAGDPANPTAGPGCETLQFSGIRRLYDAKNTLLAAPAYETQTAPATDGFPAWPAWLPDSSGVVFHNPVHIPNGVSALTTWSGAEAELWFVPATASPTSPAPTAVAMNALNGKLPNGQSYLPKDQAPDGGIQHPDDTVLNYEPTVSPIASGGYFWVVFTSRRMYGNVTNADATTGATDSPYDIGNGTYPVNKKLWVAAIDINPTAGKDPSHPAFYLPAQELNAPNMRGFWVPAPCLANGASCTTGDECCGGYCEQGDGGALMCTNNKPSCAAEYDKCTKTSDCCGAAQGFTCINAVCSRPMAL